jgi:hypothetical protein
MLVLQVGTPIAYMLSLREKPLQEKTLKVETVGQYSLLAPVDYYV